MPNRAERRAAERAARKSDSTASEAQIHANRENAQHSTGPSTPEGKETVSQNRRSHGLSAGRFFFLPDENARQYQQLAQSVYEEYDPQTDTEARLADSLIQHYWLMQRAIHLQTVHFNDDKKFALFLRYQSVHERSYYKAQKELIQFQKQRAQDQIGFESQNRLQEAHQAKVRLTHARAQDLEVETACRQAMEVPLPGHCKIPFELVAQACSIAIATLVNQFQQQAPAQTQAAAA